MGDRKKAYETGNAIVEFGNRNSNIRSMVMGHFILGCSALLDGDLPSTIKYSQQALQISLDPFFSTFPKMILGQGYALSGQFREAHATSQEILNFSRDLGNEWLGSFANVVLGIVLITEGHMGKGLKMLKDELSASLKNERRCFNATLEHTLGSVYLQIVKGEGDLSIATIVNNIGFLLKNVPFAAKKAEQHFSKAMAIATEIGAKGILAQVYLDLGRLQQAKRRKHKAKECFSKAIELFEQCGAGEILKQAKNALESL
jgi:tetratricopeptide (TPR) repeat protein